METRVLLGVRLITDVYNLYTVEFHNELYGFIKSQAYQAGHLNGITFDDWLLQELKKEDKQATKRDWYEIENGQKAQRLKQVTNPQLYKTYNSPSRKLTQSYI
ncbi:MAG: hypothetical protein U5L75_01530 [Candidatus Campbellbacteria bacterium]|nr:hypothetical protein [Candidatus Campbellbacteria bacterium]